MLCILHLASSRRGKSGSYSISPRKLWWSAWYLPKVMAEGTPMGMLQNIANRRLVFGFINPDKWVRSWISTCKIWQSVAPKKYTFRRNNCHDKSYKYATFYLAKIDYEQAERDYYECQQECIWFVRHEAAGHIGVVFENQFSPQGMRLLSYNTWEWCASFLLWLIERRVLFTGFFQANKVIIFEFCLGFLLNHRLF